MRKVYIILVIFLFIFVGYLNSELYRVDKLNFISPIDYGYSPIPIRVDLAGDGHFGASRNDRRKHKGVDIVAELGAPIYAPLGGIVITAEHERGYGNHIEIKHKTYSLRTLYAHLSEMIVAKNQFVRQGQVIGFVGKTGNARGRRTLPHLHFEMYQDGKLTDPSIYLQ